MDNKKEILELLEKSLNGEISDWEEHRLEELLGMKNLSETVLNKEEKQETEDRMLKSITSSIRKREKRYSLNGAWFKVAASIIIFIAIGLLVQHFNKDKVELLSGKVEVNDLQPGRDKVVLTLSDGSKISLDNKENRVLANNNGLIIKEKDGHIEYDDTQLDNPTNTGVNTISTPNAGQYKIILSDGTKVWLNAASELKFPAVFGDGERLVELSGEAYFEVHKGKKPFKVLARNTVVEVLGTHFNVMAYKDEDKSETTLLEGSVNIVSGGKNQRLIPGEKSVCSVNNNNIKVEKVDAELAIGWKNGLFTFNNTPIKQVMRQIERSYDVDVVYEGEIPTTLFTGVIPVKNNASKALELISDASGIKFNIEGKKIIVKN